MRVNFFSTLRAVVPALALSVPALAWTSIYEQLQLQPESRVWVEGTSTVRSFSCKAGDVNANVDAAPNAVAQIALGEKSVHTVRVRMAAEKLDCGNGTMNDHMRKALKADANPEIDFRLGGYELARGAEGLTSTLNGTLSLGGVQKPVSIPAVGRVEGGALHVTGSYPLNMTEYDLKPPTLMFGRIKVGDVVTVKFDLLLKS